MNNIPVITIDGPSASGKGTIAQKVARILDWHFLDSGALYRAVAWTVIDKKIDPNDQVAVKNLLENISIKTQVTDSGDDAKIYVNNKEVTDEIRSEECSKIASITAAFSFVREALLDRQRGFRQLPGLVTDGRDMGTVVFPDAQLKFYITANVAERAKRRFNQLKQKGKDVNLAAIHSELVERDKRDANRVISPAKPADDVILIDTTEMNVDAVFQLVMQHVREILNVM